MRRPVSGRDAVRSQVIDALEAQEIKETFRDALRSQALGTKAGGAWRKQRKEASHRCDCQKTGGIAASPVGERRGVGTATQQRSNSCSSRVKEKGKTKSKPFQEEKRQSPKPSSNRLVHVPLLGETTGRQSDRSTG